MIFIYFFWKVVYFSQTAVYRLLCHLHRKHINTFFISCIKGMLVMWRCYLWKKWQTNICDRWFCDGIDRLITWEECLCDDYTSHMCVDRQIAWSHWNITFIWDSIQNHIWSYSDRSECAGCDVKQSTHHADTNVI